MSNSFILWRFIVYFIIHFTWCRCTTGDVCPDARVCAHTLANLHILFGSRLPETPSVKQQLHSTREISRAKLQCLRKGLGVGFGQRFCSCQGDPKDGFTPAFPGTLAQLMQVGSLPGVPQERLLFLLYSDDCEEQLFENYTVPYFLKICPGFWGQAWAQPSACSTARRVSCVSAQRPLRCGRDVWIKTLGAIWRGLAWPAPLARANALQRFKDLERALPKGRIIQIIFSSLDPQCDAVL